MTDQKKKPGRKKKGPSLFSKNLTVLMKDRGLSVVQVARLIDIAPSVITGWTSGSQPADLLLVLKLCQTVGADFQAILTGVPSGSKGSVNITDIFEVETADALSGLFWIDTKKLRPKQQK